jgi:hypothetical protein
MHKRLFDEEPYTCDPPVTPGEQGDSLAGKRDGYVLPSLLSIGVFSRRQILVTRQTRSGYRVFGFFFALEVFVEHDQAAGNNFDGIAVNEDLVLL